MMNSARKINLVVLHDLDAARAAIEQAVAAGDETTLPGLRRALEILDATPRGDDDIKIRWARQYLASAGVPAGENSARAIKVLREAVPSLGLADAVELVKLAADR